MSLPLQLKWKEREECVEICNANSPLYFQLSSWFKELEAELNIGTEVAVSVEQAEDEVVKFDHQRDITLDASVNTVSEGQSIIDQLG